MPKAVRMYVQSVACCHRLMGAWITEVRTADATATATEVKHERTGARDPASCTHVPTPNIATCGHLLEQHILYVLLLHPEPTNDQSSQNHMEIAAASHR